MKSISILVVAAVAAAAASGLTPCKLLSLCAGGPCAGPAGEAQPVCGRYLEARDVTVFAGACHYNSEVLSGGRRALAAWSIESGAFEGVELAGVVVAASIDSPANLQEGAQRTSVLYVDEAASPRQRDAALAWVRANAGESLGQVEGVRVVALELQLHDDAYALEIPGVLALKGVPMADGACCTMPDHRWYEPLAPVLAAVVGMSSECRFVGAGARPRWSYDDANNAFVGRFGAQSGLALAAGGTAQ